MFYTTKRVSDIVLQQYCAPKNSENCLRNILLKGLESSRVVQDSSVCCSVCIGKVPYHKLDILKSEARQYRKRPIAVRDISVDLKKQLEIDLKLERSSIISEQPHACIFGEQYVCCDAVIEEICCRASYITCVDDMTLLRPELRHRFYSVVVKNVVNAPPAKKRRQR